MFDVSLTEEALHKSENLLQLTKKLSKFNKAVNYLGPVLSFEQQ